MHDHARRICVCKLAQGKRNRTWAHIERAALLLGVIISRSPPKPFFHLKRLVAADWTLAGECNRERKGRIISTYNSPQNYCRAKEKGGKGASGREGEGDIGKSFCSFPFFPPSIASPFSCRATWTRWPRVLHCGWGEQVGSHQASFLLSFYQVRHILLYSVWCFLVFLSNEKRLNRINGGFRRNSFCKCSLYLKKKP